MDQTVQNAKADKSLYWINISKATLSHILAYVKLSAIFYIRQFNWPCKTAVDSLFFFFLFQRLYIGRYL